MQPTFASLEFEQNHHQHTILSKPNNTASPDFPISTPQNLNHPFQPHPSLLHLQHHLKQEQQPVFLQQQHPHHHHFFQHQQQLRPPFHHHHQLQEHDPEEEGLHRQMRQHGQASPQPSMFTVDFKLGLNENSGYKKVGTFMNQEAHEAPTFIDGNEDNPPPFGLLLSRCWHPHEDSASIKEPFWKQLNRCDTKQGSEIEGNKSRHHNKSLHTQEVGESGAEKCKNLEGKYTVFSELEAIYSLATIGETKQAGSGSAITGENSPANAGFSVPFDALHGQDVGVIDAANTATGVDNGSENSIGEEASLRKSENRKRKRRMEEELDYVGGFIENVVKKVLDYQEMLHRKFLEVIERMDKERKEREETWRRKEAEKYNREAIARAHEQARVSSREAQIIACIEKITGQSINLPARMSPLLMQSGIPNEPFKELTPVKIDDSNSRWPKAEVEALIQVRSSIETKFQEPGLKGPLWDEVSSLMCSMGYQRSAKRCKEKWENINKYFRKAKENTKRSQQSKTCSYFHQLDQLYSKPHANHSPSSSSQVGTGNLGYSDVIQAFIAGNHLSTMATSSGENIKIAEMGSSRLEFECTIKDREGIEHGSHEQKEEQFVDDKNKDGEGPRVGDAADADMTM